MTATGIRTRGVIIQIPGSEETGPSVQALISFLRPRRHDDLIFAVSGRCGTTTLKSSEEIHARFTEFRKPLSGVHRKYAVSAGKLHVRF